MPAIEISVKGIVELLDRLDPDDYTRAIYGALDYVLRDLILKVQPYPPESEANRPPGSIVHVKSKHVDGSVIVSDRPANRWYERGQGMRYANGMQYASSESSWQLWFSNVSVYPHGVDASLWNQAWYSGFLYDAYLQPKIFKGRGWRAITDEVRMSYPLLQEMLVSAIYNFFQEK